MAESPETHRSTPPTGADARLQQRSRALGDPTRYRIYQWIAHRERPVAVAELTDAFGLNHNTVRLHLKKLADADLVEESVEPPRGPGRPRRLYRLTGDAAARWNDEGPYERLSLLLLEVATTNGSALEVGRAAGRRAHLDTEAGDPITALSAAMAAQGFAPQVASGGAPTEFVLRNCPFAAAAEANPRIVCDLHRGMLEGLTERLSGVSSARLLADDPRLGRCAVHFAVTPST